MLIVEFAIFCDAPLNERSRPLTSNNVEVFSEHPLLASIQWAIQLHPVSSLAAFSVQLHFPRGLISLIGLPNKIHNKLLNITLALLVSSAVNRCSRLFGMKCQ